MEIINWKKADQSFKNRMFTRGYMGSKNDVRANVAEIITKVRQEGDAALLHYTELYDGVKLTSIKASSKATNGSIKDSIREAIDEAYERIENFHQLQIPRKIESDVEGVKVWREWRPIESVGLYVPGGTAPLISTLLMLAIPARLAGCKNIALVTPPNRNGDIAPEILYAAKLCGMKTIYSVGGAQAIAALAYGTKTIPKVNKIFGPGNKYVTEAKIQVSISNCTYGSARGAALDMPAGPSEVLVIADGKADPQLIAFDLLAQLEHDIDAVAICITTNGELAEKINSATKNQLESLKRRTIINKSLDHSHIIVVKDLDEAFEISNDYAPEHLILHLGNASDYTKFVKNAGSVFVGKWSAEALGDYASRSNHVLPTYGYAKTYSGLSIESFMKSITFQEATEEGLIKLANTVETLADFEGLDAHKMSISIRKSLIERTLIERNV